MRTTTGCHPRAERLERRTLLSLVPAEAEFRANTFTTNGQSVAAIAADADGDFVVVWQSFGQDGTTTPTYGVYARRYNATGVAQGLEFRVNTTTAGEQSAPAVAMDADGDFVVAWSGNGPGDASGVFAQRYNAAGAAQGGEFRANTFTTNAQAQPAVAASATGEFVIAWESFGQEEPTFAGVYAQRYRAAGEARGGEFRVNLFTPGDQRAPDVAADASGDFVVAWTSDGQDGSNEGVYAQRFDASGARLGTELRANTFTTAEQFQPAVAMDASGDFVVAWTSYAQDAGPSSGIYAQRYDASGAAAGSEFRVNTFTSSLQWKPDVAMDADGDVLVAWESVNQDGSLYGIYAQSFSAAGIPQGDEFRVNTFTTGSQLLPAVAMSATGDAVVAWHSSGQDGSSHGVYAQRYDETNSDAAAPVVGGLVADFTTVAPAQRLLGAVSSLTISFSEDMSVTGGVTGPNSVTNRNNYRLTRNGVDVSSQIPFPAFSFNSITRKYEARMPLSPALANGTYLLTVRDALRDLAGNALDGDLDGAPGGDFTRAFAVAAPAAPGPEFLVNTTTDDAQELPDVARDPDGDFVVVWQGNGPGDDQGIFAQRYDRTGAAQGGEFRVNTFTTNIQAAPSVAMDNGGNFVVAWQSVGQEGATNVGVFAQRYNAAGAAQGGEIHVNVFTTAQQQVPSIAMDADGDFVIAWASNGQEAAPPNSGVYARRFSAAGAAQGGEIHVNTFTTSEQDAPAVAVDVDGDFVVVWQSFSQGTTNYNIYAQRFSAAGAPQGAEFRVAAATSRQQSPDVAMDADGDFVVVWDEDSPNVSDIRARRFSAAGAAQGNAFQVNNFIGAAHRFPAVAMDARGSFVVAWDGQAPGSDDTGVSARGFDAAGAPRQTPEFRVNTFTTGVQRFAALAGRGDDEFVIAWQSEGQDGSGDGVFAQRFLRPFEVTVSDFRFATAPHRLSFTFNDDVSASLDANDVVLENLTTMQTIPSSQLSLTYDAATNTATFSYTGSASGIAGVLPDGNYRATLLAAGVTTPEGQPLSSNHVLNFFFLQGDANHDGRVNLGDFNVLAANFGQSNGTFSQGDFDYSGNVNLADFNILASRFGTVLTGPGAGAGSNSGQRRFPDGEEDAAGDDLLA